MRRIAKRLGLAVVFVAIMAVAITGAAFAAGANTADTGNQGEERPYSDCVPNSYSWDYNWDYNYESPGSHGNGTALAAGGNTAENDCVPNSWESPGPHGNGKAS